MMWLHWLMDSSGHSKDDRLSVRSWMGRLCLTKKSSITFNIISLSTEYNWHSMRTCAVVYAFPHSHKQSPWQSDPKHVIIQVLSWDLVLELDFNLLTGTDGHIMWRDLLLSSMHQALCHFFNMDFFIWFFMTERDVGLASGSMASAMASLAYPSTSSFAARPACLGTQWRSRWQSSCQQMHWCWLWTGL